MGCGLDSVAGAGGDDGESKGRGCSLVPTSSAEDFLTLALDRVKKPMSLLMMIADGPQEWMMNISSSLKRKERMVG